MKSRLDRLENLSTTFTAKDAVQVGLTQYDLQLLTSEGPIEKIRRGVYQKGACSFDEIDLLKAAVAVLGNPSCICLWSAASFHDLTDEIIEKSWAYVPYGKYSHLDSMVVVRKRNPRWRIGIEEVNDIKVTSIERTVVDILSSPKHVSDSDAFKMAKRALSEKKTTLKDLTKMAKKLDVYKRIKLKLTFLQELYD